MRELSVFIDESGDFGPYAPHSPFYLIALLFHDQSIDLSKQTRLTGLDAFRNLPGTAGGGLPDGL